MYGVVIHLTIYILSILGTESSLNLQKCASIYSTRIDDIVDPSRTHNRLFAKLAEAKLRIYRTPHQFSCTDALVINASPGSSGTRSLFLAMLALNVSSSHYFRRGFNCSYGMSPLVSHKDVVFWGDTPFSHLWWYIMQACPSARFVLTIINPEKWISARMSHYNSSASSHVEWDYILPIPFLPPVDPYPFPMTVTPPLPPELLHETTTSSPVSVIDTHTTKNRMAYSLTSAQADLIASMLSLKNASNSAAVEAYKAFMDLVRCAVSPDRLLVIDLTSPHTTPSRFWTDLVQHMGIAQSLVPTALDDLIAAGLPYWGRKACRLGLKHTCPFSTLLHRRQSYRGKGWPGQCK